MTLEEARAFLAEYDALPDDLTARLNWPGWEKLPCYTVVCTDCGAVRRSQGRLDMDDLRRLVQKGQAPDMTIRGVCSKCAGPEEEDAEEG